MKADELFKVKKALRPHVMAALIYLLKQAEVGDNKLELKPHEFCYKNDYETFLVEAIEMDFSFDKKGELIIYRRTEGSNFESTIDVSNLKTTTMLKLLGALEKITGCYYDQPLA